MNHGANILRVVLLLLFISAGFILFNHWNTPPTEALLQRTAMASQLSRHASLSIPIPDGRPKMVIAQVIGDYHGILTKQLRQAIERRNVAIVDLAPWQSLVPGRLQWLLEQSAESATTEAAKLCVPYLLSCRILDWPLGSDTSRDLRLEVKLVAVESRTILYENTWSLSDWHD